MKVDDNMKKYLMFIFIVLFAFPMFVNAEELYYDYFYKKDEQGNYINDAEFKLKSANGKLEDDVTYDSEERAYKYSQLVDETYDNLMKIIPTDIQDTLSGLNSMADFTPIINVYNEGTISNFDRMRVDCVIYG